MTISVEARNLLQAKLRSLKAEKKGIVDRIQVLNSQKDSLGVERDALIVRINHLESDLA